MTQPVIQTEVEQFLYHEALLIDNRHFQQWLELLTEDVTYSIPNQTGEGDSSEEPMIVCEGYGDLKVRVNRLFNPLNLTQLPPPRTRHFITNVIVKDADEKEFQVHSNLLVYVQQDTKLFHIPTSCEHRLRKVVGDWRICHKKVFLIAADQRLPMLPLL